MDKIEEEDLETTYQKACLRFLKVWDTASKRVKILTHICYPEIFTTAHTGVSDAAKYPFEGPSPGEIRMLEAAEYVRGARDFENMATLFGPHLG